MDWLRKVFNEPSTLVAVLSGGVIGFFVGVANGFIQRKHGGWAGFFSAIFSGMVVAIIVGLITQNYITTEPLRLAIVGVSAVISDDIFAGLKALGRGVRTDPLGSIVRVMNALRGVKRDE